MNQSPELPSRQLLIDTLKMARAALYQGQLLGDNSQALTISAIDAVLAQREPFEARVERFLAKARAMIERRSKERAAQYEAMQRSCDKWLKAIPQGKPAVSFIKEPKP